MIDAFFRTKLKIFRSLFLTFSLVALAVGSAVGGAQPAIAQADEPRTHLEVERLTQYPNGPGLIVCDPTIKTKDIGLYDFSAGCTRWLQFLVGGQAELSRTPLWTPIDHAWRTLKKNQPISVEEGGRLSELLGITHVVLSDITGDKSEATLTLRLWKVPEGKPLTDPIPVTGTPEEIRARLPELAFGFSRLLGVTRPSIPQKVGETADELQMLGHLPWAPGTEINGPKLAPLEAIVLDPQRQQTTLFACFLYMINRGYLRDVPAFQKVVPVLARQLPENATLFGEMGRQAHWTQQLGPDQLPYRELQLALRKYPTNYALRAGQSYFLRTEGKWDEARLAAEQGVRSSTGNPDAWMHLSDALWDQASTIRANRDLSKLEKQEFDEVTPLFNQRVLVMEKVVDIDPTYGKGWHNLSIAAAFAGLPEEADEAFWEAVRLEPTDANILWWGFDLYGWRWYNNQDRLIETAACSLRAADKWHTYQRMRIALSMWYAHLDELALKVLRTDDERATYNNEIATRTRPEFHEHHHDH